METRVREQLTKEKLKEYIKQLLEEAERYKDSDIRIGRSAVNARRNHGEGMEEAAIKIAAKFGVHL